jgi:hypothetical protein
VLISASFQWVRVFSREQVREMHQLACVHFFCIRCEIALLSAPAFRFSSIFYRANLRLKTGHTLACAQSDAKDLESKIFYAVLYDLDLS